MNGIDIRKARERIGWTVEQLAERSGVSKSSISRYENGTSINQASVTKLAKVLDIASEAPFSVQLMKLRSESEGKQKPPIDIVSDGEKLLDAADVNSLEYGELTKLIGENCVKAGLYSKSLPFFHRAMNVFFELGYQQRFAKCMVELANAHYALGRYYVALEHCQFAENELVKMEFPDFTLARLYTIASMVCCQINDYHQAMQYAELAEVHTECVPASEQAHYIGSRMYARGACLLDVEQYSDAADAFHEAYHLFQQIESTYSCLSMKINIALTWIRSGDTKRGNQILMEVSNQILNNDAFESLGQFVLRAQMEMSFVDGAFDELRRFATCLIQDRSSISVINYVDAIRFMARVEFLDGDRETALTLFSTVAEDFTDRPGFEPCYKELMTEFMLAYSKPEKYRTFLENKRKTSTTLG